MLRQLGGQGQADGRLDLAGAQGALLVGDAQAVTDKILYEHELFHHDRFLMQLTVGTMPHAQVMHAIEIYGTVVAPAVRRALTLIPNP